MLGHSAKGNEITYERRGRREEASDRDLRREGPPRTGPVGASGRRLFFEGANVNVSTLTTVVTSRWQIVLIAKSGGP